MSKEITICSGCRSEVQGIGEDLIDYCPECETIVEGNTEQVLESEWEKENE